MKSFPPKKLLPKTPASQNRSLSKKFTRGSPQKLRAKTSASERSSSFSFGRAASRRAIAQYLSGRDEAQYFNTFSNARPERILAHIPHALRLVYSADKSGDHISTARPDCLRAGNIAPINLLARTSVSIFRTADEICAHLK